MQRIVRALSGLLLMCAASAAQALTLLLTAPEFLRR